MESELAALVLAEIVCVCLSTLGLTLKDYGLGDGLGAVEPTAEPTVGDNGGWQCISRISSD